MNVCGCEVGTHQSGHSSEVESFEKHQPVQDVDGIMVLSFHSVFLKRLHIFPVLQRQPDLQSETRERYRKLYTGSSLFNI